jgi:ribonuclease P protein component
VRSYDSLRGDAEFARVRRRGRRIDAKHLAIVAVPAQSGRRPRIAVVTPKGFGDAVKRNRARRRLVAALGAQRLPGNPYDMIVTARDSVRTVEFPELCRDLHEALARLGGR